MEHFFDLFKSKGTPVKLNLFGEEIEINPDTMKFLRQGIDQYQNSAFADAIFAFSKAINIQPTIQMFYTMRGTAFEDIDDNLNAEKDFRKALEFHPTNYFTAFRLGMVLFKSNDIENAIKWVKVAHRNYVVYNDLEKIGITNKEIFNTNKKVISSNLGNFLIQQKKYDEGFKYLDEAIEIDPNYSKPYLAKGGALLEIGKRGDAIIFLKKASELGDLKATNFIYEIYRKYNPLNISEDPRLNQKSHLPNFVSNIANELLKSFTILKERYGNVSTIQLYTMTIYFAIDLLIEFQNKGLKVLPVIVISDIKKQVLTAAQNNFTLFDDQSIIDGFFSEIDNKIWEPEIINKTQVYMRSLNR